MANKHYALADLHGCLELWKQIDKFTDDTDIIYFLGDGGDRGPQGWDTIKALAQSPKVIYLKGNHEDLMSKAMFEMLDDEVPGWNYQISCGNGGQLTLEDALLETDNRAWARWLNKLPTYVKYINKNNETIHLSHAGFTLKQNKNKEIIVPEDIDLIWHRKHLDDYPIEQIENHYSVFGHTPTPVLVKEEEWEAGALYLPGNKINIDNGSFFSGYTCLLDLDTFDEHIFSQESN